MKKRYNSNVIQSKWLQRNNRVKMQFKFWKLSKLLECFKCYSCVYATPPPPTPRTNFFITLELLKVWSWNFDSVKSNSLERFLGWNQTPLQLLRICKWLILRLTFLDIDMIRFWNFPKYISLKRKLLASFLSLLMSAKISFWFVNYTLVTRPKY